MSDMFARLPGFLTDAMARVPGLARHLDGVDPMAVSSRDALASLPMLRKSDLMQMQAEDPPFGGFLDLDRLAGGRLFMSPGPIWEGHGAAADPFNGVAALEAAGFVRGDRVHNAFAYHMTPGGFILDEAARALGAIVFPAGTGQTEQQVEAIATLRPTGFIGTPDYLKVLLEAADGTGRDVSSITKALVSGGALFPSLRRTYAERGITVMQAYATADVGVIAYETRSGKALDEGMRVNDAVIVEIVRPGTGDPLADGEVGEVTVTTFNEVYPLVRFGTGDLSAFLPGGARLKGWMGRADQRTKVKGMFIDPAQIDRVLKRHPEATRARLVVSRTDNADRMVLELEAKEPAALDLEAVAASLRAETKLGGEVRAVHQLPNDGKVIDDRRDYERLGRLARSGRRGSYPGNGDV